MSTQLTDAELSRLEELAGKATPGPWAAPETLLDLFSVYPDEWCQVYAGNNDEERKSCQRVISVCSMPDSYIGEELSGAYGFGQAGHDASYIAAACNATPALVAELRRLRAELAAIKKDN